MLRKLGKIIFFVLLISIIVVIGDDETREYLKQKIS